MPTFTDWVYTAFVLNVFSRRIVGCQAATSLYTELAPDALDMGTWSRTNNGADLVGVMINPELIPPLTEMLRALGEAIGRIRG